MYITIPNLNTGIFQLIIVMIKRFEHVVFDQVDLFNWPAGSGVEELLAEWQTVLTLIRLLLRGAV